MTAFLAPRITANDEQVCIVAWHVEEGGYVEAGGELVDLETSKTTVTIEATVSGVVERRLREGQVIDVGAPLCSIIERPNGAAHADPGRNAPAPLAVMQTDDPGAHPHATACERVEDAAHSPAVGARFSPAALRALAEARLDRSLFDGHGLVTSSTIRRCREQTGSEASSRVRPRSDPAVGNEGALPAHARREAISPTKRMEIGALQLGSAHALSSSLTTFFDSEQIRRRLESEGLFGGSLQPIIIYEAARLLGTLPRLTAFYHDGFLHFYDRVDIGLAIDIGRGLKVITLRGADELLPREIFEKTIDIGLRYLDDRLEPSELFGSSVTITDLSSSDILQFVPILNGRQSLIIGIGGDALRAMHPMAITATFDHRATNGKEVANFLQALRQRILSYAPAEAAGMAACEDVVPERAGEPAACDVCGTGLREIEVVRGGFLAAHFREDGTLRPVCHACSSGYL